MLTHYSTILASAISVHLLTWISTLGGKIRDSKVQDAETNVAIHDFAVQFPFETTDKVIRQVFSFRENACRGPRNSFQTDVDDR